MKHNLNLNKWHLSFYTYLFTHTHTHAHTLGSQNHNNFNLPKKMAVF